MFGKSNQYMALDVWIIANIVQLATLEFCRRFLDRHSDPCGRQFDQMTQAARSGQANIAEGSARGATSKETEMKLLDVARASLAELLSDYTFLLMSRKLIPWSANSEAAKEIYTIALDKADYGDDWTASSCRHILCQKSKFDRWLASDDMETTGNAMIILIKRCINALNHLLEAKGSDFAEKGGFSEKLYQIRSEAKQKDDEQSPRCPQCGGAMRKRMARKGANAGRPFWSCVKYPDCRGTRAFG